MGSRSGNRPRGFLGPLGVSQQATGWLLLLLVVLQQLCFTWAFSTCKTLDMDLMKRKRIEAIRGQILSKLKFPKPPEVEDSEPRVLSEEVMALYNSTLEVIREMAAEEPQETVHEEYYAKEVHRFTMLSIDHRESRQGRGAGTAKGGHRGARSQNRLALRWSVSGLVCDAGCRLTQIRKEDDASSIDGDEGEGTISTSSGSQGLGTSSAL